MEREGLTAQEKHALTVQQAWRQLRQQAIGDWLTELRTPPGAVSHQLGGEAWLLLTRKACAELKAADPTNADLDQLVEQVRADLVQGCHLILERDRKKTSGAVLRINSNSWFLRAKPGESEWVVVSINPQEKQVLPSLEDLPWQLQLPAEPDQDSYYYEYVYENKATALPLWLLARAEWRDPAALPESPNWTARRTSNSEALERQRLAETRRTIAPATRDLREAFEILDWSRTHRERRRWKLRISPGSAEEGNRRRATYVLESDKPKQWPDLPTSFAIELNGRETELTGYPDPNSPTRWILAGPNGLPSEISVIEPAEVDRQLRNQKQIVEDLLKSPYETNLYETAVPATQIRVPPGKRMANPVEKFPDEDPWEPRQLLALQLALGDHRICAIKGPPGTGKSTVIVGIIRRLIQRKQRVLLVAPTHVALDEVLERIEKLKVEKVVSGIRFVRIAPADLERAQIKEGMLKYIPRNLGRSLIREALTAIESRMGNYLSKPLVLRALEKEFLEHIENLEFAQSLFQELATEDGSSQKRLVRAQREFEAAHEEWKRAREYERKHRSNRDGQPDNEARTFRRAKNALSTAERNRERMEVALREAESVASVAESRLATARTELKSVRQEINRLIGEIEEHLDDDDFADSSIEEDQSNNEEGLAETAGNEPESEVNLPPEFADIIGRLRTRRARLMASAKSTPSQKLLYQWREYFDRATGNDELTKWVLDNVNLVAATTQGIAANREFAKKNFDVVICDESSRVTRGEIMVPAARGSRIILVGDEKQLPPYVETDEEQLVQSLAVVQLAQEHSRPLEEVATRFSELWNSNEPEYRSVRDEVCSRAVELQAGGILPDWPESVSEVSTFEEQLQRWRRIANALTVSCFDHVLQFLEPDQFVRLNIQRRMVPEMAQLVSQPVYNGDYRSTEIEENQIRPLTTGTFKRSWMFFNTSAYCARPEPSGTNSRQMSFRQVQQGTGFINAGEAHAVVNVLEEHAESYRRKGQTGDRNSDKQPPTMMVITYYLAQAKLIDRLVAESAKLQEYIIAVLPIDRCQGQQADVVVVSFVRTGKHPPPNTGRWLQDPRRLTVALTRARRSLILIGNLNTLAAFSGDKEGEKIISHLAGLVRGKGGHHISMLGDSL
jgi:hypothetical protein